MKPPFFGIKSSTGEKRSFRWFIYFTDNSAAMVNELSIKEDWIKKIVVRLKYDLKKKL
jgi:hypothetical protein